MLVFCPGFGAGCPQSQNFRENQTCTELRSTTSRHLLPPISRWGKTMDSYRKFCRNSRTSHSSKNRNGQGRPPRPPLRLQVACWLGLQESGEQNSKQTRIEGKFEAQNCGPVTAGLWRLCLEQTQRRVLCCQGCGPCSNFFKDQPVWKRGA